tara:strand:- start:742 stop:1107 length:366 start_codon:yes stop_codon:yes gene_type:complete
MLLVSFTSGLYDKFNQLILPFLLNEPYLGIDKSELAIKIGILSSMHSGLGIGLNLIIGPLYDMIGRRVPCLIMFVSTIIGEILVPNVRTFSPGIMTCTFLQEPNVLLGLIPFVPDLIAEES